MSLKIDIAITCNLCGLVSKQAVALVEFKEPKATVGACLEPLQDVLGEKATRYGWEIVGQWGALDKHWCPACKQAERERITAKLERRPIFFPRPQIPTITAPENHAADAMRYARTMPGPWIEPGPGPAIEPGENAHDTTPMNTPHPKKKRRPANPLCKSWPQCSCIFQGRKSDCVQGPPTTYPWLKVPGGI